VYQGIEHRFHREDATRRLYSRKGGQGTSRTATLINGLPLFATNREERRAILSRSRSRVCRADRQVLFMVFHFFLLPRFFFLYTYIYVTRIVGDIYSYRHKHKTIIICETILVCMSCGFAEGYVSFLRSRVPTFHERLHNGSDLFSFFFLFFSPSHTVTYIIAGNCLSGRYVSFSRKKDASHAPFSRATSNKFSVYLSFFNAYNYPAQTLSVTR